MKQDKTRQPQDKKTTRQNNLKTRKPQDKTTTRQDNNKTRQNETRRNK